MHTLLKYNACNNKHNKAKYANFAAFKITLGRIRGLNPTSTLLCTFSIYIYAYLSIFSVKNFFT